MIFKALAAIPTIIGIVEQVAAGAVLWYVSRENKETAKLIADAAAKAARATNTEERNAALDAWRAALSRPRILK